MIAKSIRRQRRLIEMSQAELARKVGVSRQTINRIENGQTGVSPQLLEKIMTELKLEIRPVDKAQ